MAGHGLSPQWTFAEFKTMKSSGYTLWLLPTGFSYNKFSSLIKRLAEENKAPIFYPHITLLGEIEQTELEVINKTKKLVLGQKPFPVTLTNIDYEDYYFRTLFVRAKITKPLLDLHNKAKKVFNMKAVPYMPHLSLLYGDFPVKVKEKIIKEIGKNQTADFTVNKVILMKGGEIKNWITINEFPFGILPTG